MNLLCVFVRALISLILLFVVTKIIGKKQISELSLFDYVIGISIGNFAAEMTVNLEIDYINGVVAIVVFGTLAYLVNYATLKSITMRRFFMGTPTILIQNGKIIKQNMIKVKFDINDLLEECRNNGCFDINEIEYGIMEANGKLSILLKSEYKPLTPNDMNMKPPKSELVANVIIDGKVMKNNLTNMHKDLKWLHKELKIKGIKLENVLLGLLDNNEKITVYEKDEQIQIKNILE